MIKVEETKSLATGYDSKKAVYCPNCGRKHTFYYGAPANCIQCGEELPNLIEMMESNLEQIRKLEYHNTGKTRRKFSLSS